MNFLEHQEPVNFWTWPKLSARPLGRTQGVFVTLSLVSSARSIGPGSG